MMKIRRKYRTKRLKGHRLLMGLCFAVIIAMALMTNLAISALAQQTDIGGADIDFFAQPVSKVTVAAGTKLEAIPLPETLYAVFRDGSTGDIPVTWNADEQYDKDATGRYAFTADIGNHTYTGDMPVIIVSVQAPETAIKEENIQGEEETQEEEVQGEEAQEEVQGEETQEEVQGEETQEAEVQEEDAQEEVVQGEETQEVEVQGEETQEAEVREEDAPEKEAQEEKAQDEEVQNKEVQDEEGQDEEVQGGEVQGEEVQGEEEQGEEIPGDASANRMLVAATETANSQDTLIAAITNVDYGGIIEITGNFTLSERIDINADKSITIKSGEGGPYIITQKGTQHFRIFGELKLEDIVLTGIGLSQYQDNGGIIIDKGNLSMEEGTVIKGCYAINNGIVDVQKGTFTMNGGEISGNTNKSNRGVISSIYGIFILNDGEIYDNTSVDGVVYCSGSVIMNGGKFYGNTSQKNGCVIMSSGSSFTMSGGKIFENKAQMGGAVYLSSRSSFKMEGGEIYDNQASEDGGAIYTEHYSYENPALTSAYTEISISNGAVVRNNKAGKSFVPPSNYAEFNSRFPGSLLDNDNINYNNPNYVITYIANNGTNDPNYYEATNVSSGKVDIITATQAAANFSAPQGKFFDGWNTSADGTGWTYGEGVLIEVSGSLTLYAQWQECCCVTITEKVLGCYADKNRDFDFTISVSQLARNSVNDMQIHYTGDKSGTLNLVDGEATFSLKDGESITFIDIPHNKEVRIVKAIDDNYITSFKDSADQSSTAGNDTDYRELNGDRTFGFINERKSAVETGITTGNMQGIYGLIGILMLLSAGSVIISIRKKHYVRL